MSFISPSYFTFFPSCCCCWSVVTWVMLMTLYFLFHLAPKEFFFGSWWQLWLSFKKYSLKSSAGLRRDNFGWHFLGDLTRLSLPTIISRGLARDAAFSKEEDPTCLQLESGFMSSYLISPIRFSIFPTVDTYTILILYLDVMILEFLCQT